MRYTILLLCLAVCVMGALGHPRRGGRGRGQADHRSPPCRVEDQDGNPVADVETIDCEGESTCTETKGARTQPDGSLTTAFFCTRSDDASRRSGDRGCSKLDKYACKSVDASGVESPRKTCSDGVACSVGPLPWTKRDGSAETLFFCAVTDDLENKDNVLRAACRVLAGEASLAEKTCSRGGECTVGPLLVTYQGQDSQAFFCAKPQREDDGGEGEQGGPGGPVEVEVVERVQPAQGGRQSEGGRRRGRGRGGQRRRG